MDSIFHEQQEGALCAQHCLNSLLQGQYYTAVDLADIARQLDDEERRHRHDDEQGIRREEQARESASANMDDTGFFSVQVIAKAISVWGLTEVNFNSSDAVAVNARQDPISQRAFICNFREHWLTIRRLGAQWFNLNSLLTGPELISDTFLALTLAQLQRDGYSIYLVVGDLPDCQADHLLTLAPVVQTERPRLIGGEEGGGSGGGGSGGILQQPREGGEDAELRRAMAMSMQDAPPVQSGSGGQHDRLTRQPTDEDEELQMAIQASLAGAGAGGSGGKPRVQEKEKEKDEQPEDELQKALAMSMECDAVEPKTDPPPSAAQPKVPQPGTTAAAMSPPSTAGATTSPTRTHRPAHAISGAAAASARSSRGGQEQTVATPNPTQTTSAATRRAAAATAFLPGGMMPVIVPAEAGPGRRMDEGAVRQSTPDPEQVRRQRNAFLDRLEKGKKE